MNPDLKRNDAGRDVYDRTIAPPKVSNNYRDAFVDSIRCRKSRMVVFPTFRVSDIHWRKLDNSTFFYVLRSEGEVCTIFYWPLPRKPNNSFDRRFSLGSRRRRVSLATVSRKQ